MRLSQTVDDCGEAESQPIETVPPRMAVFTAFCAWRSEEEASVGVMKPTGEGPGRRERAKRGGNPWDWIKGEMIDISF